MSEKGSVRLELRGEIGSVIFDRPAARNAMTWEMYAQLQTICAELATISGLRAVTFQGAGGNAFVAGTDIAQFESFRDGSDGVEYEKKIDSCISAIEQLPVPTLAVIEGWAVGGGLVIAQACDFRIGTSNTRLGIPIAKTLGNTLSIESLNRVRSAFGVQRTRRMLMLAETIHAQEAKVCGFLHDVCPPEDLKDLSASMCAALAALAPLTLRTVKEGMRRLDNASIPDGEDLVRICYGSEDFREGVSAFISHRKPAWQGR